RQLLELAHYAKAHGHSITVYAVLYSQRCLPQLATGLEIEVVPADSPLEPLWKRAPTRETSGLLLWPLQTIRHDYRVLMARLEMARKIARHIADDVDLINGHDWMTTEMLWFARQRLRVPMVWQCNDLPVAFKVGVNAPTDQSGKARLRHFGRYLLRDSWLQVFERKWVSAVDQIIVNVERNRKLVQRCYGRDARVIRCGVNPGTFFPREVRDRTTDRRPFRILSAAVFYHYRRFEDLIRAVSILKPRYQVHLDIIGYEGFVPQYARALRDLVTELQLDDCVRFHGAVSEDALREAYEQSDVFVWCNHNQSWGNAVFEAMGCGTPVVVSTSTGAAEVLKDGENALLVPPLRPDQLAARIEELILSPALRQRLSRNGRDLVQSMSWDNYSSAMLALFEEMLTTRRG
ncbi:MAG: glycosyltransferase family 4 protein, partial [Chloroflexus sp.]|nr:glycosyltransferase family 4 protein [Chloroflexus sp.]